MDSRPPGLDDLIGGITAELDERLAATDADLARHYPGARPGRQPVHTVYVPADRFHAGLVREYADAALAAVGEHEAVLLDLLGGDRDLLDRVRAKLAAEPVEDLRIDLEDGYGTRPDDEEDRDVVRAAGELRTALDRGTAPPGTGIRFKSLEAPTRRRGVRTLALFLERLAQDGTLPTGFVVTLPKVTAVEQVEALVHAAERLEVALGLGDRVLAFEIQVETPQSILGPDGTALVARMVHASDGRCTGLHYGTYDYSAYCGIAAAQQSLEHPVADHAKAVMQAAAAGTGVRLSDGSTNVLPIGARTPAWHSHRPQGQRAHARHDHDGRGAGVRQFAGALRVHPLAEASRCRCGHPGQDGADRARQLGRRGHARQLQRGRRLRDESLRPAARPAPGPRRAGQTVQRRPSRDEHRGIELRHRDLREPGRGECRHRDVGIDPEPVESDHARRDQADGRPHQQVRRDSDHGRSGHGGADGA